MNFNQSTQLFQTEMLSKGITPPKDIIADAQLQRFHINGDKPSTKNGWYIFYGDNVPCGIFGSWKIGEVYKWCAVRRENMSRREFAVHKQRIEEAKQYRNAERAMELETASMLAEHKFFNCPPADQNHVYLMRKHVKPFYARQCGSYLVLPVVDFAGKFWGLQNIAPNGSKWFLPNSAITGHFIPIQHQPAADINILICEGFATGATLAECYSNACVIAACNAGNLKPVALNIRKHLPESEITICADIDPIGLLKANEAANAAKAVVKKPRFPVGTCNKLTDWNDLFCLHVHAGALV